jgi:hypothetical protein
MATCRGHGCYSGNPLGRNIRAMNESWRICSLHKGRKSQHCQMFVKDFCQDKLAGSNEAFALRMTGMFRSNHCSAIIHLGIWFLMLEPPHLLRHFFAVLLQRDLPTLPVVFHRHRSKGSSTPAANGSVVSAAYHGNLEIVKSERYKVSTSCEVNTAMKHAMTNCESVETESSLHTDIQLGEENQQDRVTWKARPASTRWHCREQCHT